MLNPKNQLRNGFLEISLCKKRANRNLGVAYCPQGQLFGTETMEMLRLSYSRFSLVAEGSHRSPRGRILEP